VQDAFVDRVRVAKHPRDADLATEPDVGALDRRKCSPPVFFVMLSNEKMSGKLKASRVPSSFTADLDG
jgi:hypothetical protein